MSDSVDGVKFIRNLIFTTPGNIHAVIQYEKGLDSEAEKILPIFSSGLDLMGRYNGIALNDTFGLTLIKEHGNSIKALEKGRTIQGKNKRVQLDDDGQYLVNDYDWIIYDDDNKMTKDGELFLYVSFHELTHRIQGHYIKKQDGIKKDMLSSSSI